MLKVASSYYHRWSCPSRRVEPERQQNFACQEGFASISDESYLNSTTYFSKLHLMQLLPNYNTPLDVYRPGQFDECNVTGERFPAPFWMNEFLSCTDHKVLRLSQEIVMSAQVHFEKGVSILKSGNKN